MRNEEGGTLKRWIGYEHGINLGGWLSQCPLSVEHYDHFIQKEDFAKISQWNGVDHVRIPISYELLTDRDGNWKKEGFERLHTITEWCQEYHFNLIIDLHKCRGYSFDPDEQETGLFEREDYQQQFLALWEEIAKQFANNEHIAFELLNEIVEEKNKDNWNALALKCIQRIRKYAQDTKILVGSYWNNSMATVKDLLLPPDENIVYNFHCYAPLVFTHQGASWVEGMKSDFQIDLHHTIEEFRQMTQEMMPYELGTFRAISDCNRAFDETYFEELFKSAINTAKERNVALYCGEYGVISFAKDTDILEWYTMIHRVFEKYHIGRAAWTYKGMHYDIAGEHLDAVRKELNQVL